MNYPVSKTTYYRRIRRARELGCSIDELPDNRGKHGNHTKGSSHPRWNNGRLITPDGYVLVRVGRSHPLADPNGYCHEHKLVMCSYLGRNLLSGEAIHHKNGDKTDNRIENLEIKTCHEHSLKHFGKLTAQDVIQIRELYHSGDLTQAELAAKFNVPIQRISKIVKGQVWKSAGGPIIQEDQRRRGPDGKFVGKKRAGRLLDGVEHNEFPEVYHGNG